MSRFITEEELKEQFSHFEDALALVRKSQLETIEILEAIKELLELQ